MFFVVVSSWNFRFQEYLEANGCILVKKKKPTVYIYYYPKEVPVKMFKGMLFKKYGLNYVNSVYGFFNGYIDMFEYLPLEKKLANPYFNKKIKDFSEEEQKDFLAKLNNA